jgi:hypothetical protein
VSSAAQSASIVLVAPFGRLYCGQIAVVVGRVVGHSSLVRAGHQRRADHEVGRGAVTGDGDVPHDRDPQQRLDVRVVGLGLERVPEEDQEVDAAVGDHRPDLEVAS